MIYSVSLSNGKYLYRIVFNKKLIVPNKTETGSETGSEEFPVPEFTEIYMTGEIMSQDQFDTAMEAEKAAREFEKLIENTIECR